MILSSSHSQEFLLERLFKRCTFGYHTVLQDGDKGKLVVQQRIMCKSDTYILKLPLGVIKKMSSKSKNLKKILKEQSKIYPECDFTTFLTYDYNKEKRLSFKDI